MGKMRDPRPLQLKIRVLAPQGTTREELVETLERAIQTGRLPLRWRVRWVDWAKGEEGDSISTMEAAGGHTRIEGNALAELKLFYSALTHPTTRVRVERVEPE